MSRRSLVWSSSGSAIVGGRVLGLALSVMLAAVVLVSWPAPGQDAVATVVQPADRTGQSWTADEARAHADRYNDPALWNMKFLKADIATDQADAADRVSMPFPRLAFNAPTYELTGRVMPGLAFSPIPLAEPMAGAFVGVHEPLELKDVPAGKEWHEVVRTQPVLAIIARGPAPISDKGGSAVSRSHPHYFFQGALTSTHGEIRWTAVRMADGTEIAIINGRVLDLSQGNLILVRQHEDGSIRIHQHATRLQPACGADLRRSIPDLLKQEELRRVLDGAN